MTGAAPDPATVVICTHRHQDDLVDVLSAVDRQAPPSAEVILVRSGIPEGAPLPPGLADWLNSVRRPVRAVCEPAVGVSRARNRGMAVATHDVVLFLDEDAVPRAGWYRHMVSAMGRAGVAAAGGSIRPAWPGGVRPAWLPGRLSSYYGERDAGSRRAVRQRLFGANMALRRSLAAPLGGFRVDLGHVGSRRGVGEDTEISLRLERAGLRIAEASGSVVDHRVAAAQVRLGWVLRRSWQEGQDLARLEPVRPGPRQVVRSAKLAVLLLVWPFALIRRRAAVYVTARALANLSYLCTRRAGATRVWSPP